MDDTLKVVTVSLFALLSLHFSLERRARDDATRQVNQAFHSTGSLHSTVESRGMLGMLANDVWSVDLYSDHQTSDQLPFYLYPRSGWKGHIRHLRLHVTHFTLSGFPVDRLEADIPFVTYDLGHAMYHDRLHIRSSGIGPAEVQDGRAGDVHPDEIPQAGESDSGRLPGWEADDSGQTEPAGRRDAFLRGRLPGSS